MGNTFKNTNYYMYVLVLLVCSPDISSANVEAGLVHLADLEEELRRHLSERFGKGLRPSGAVGRVFLLCRHLPIRDKVLTKSVSL